MSGNKRVDFDDYLTGTVEGELNIADGHEFTTHIDEMGRGTRMMMKYFADGDDDFLSPLSLIPVWGVMMKLLKLWLM